jgi:hypothetical protein
VLIGDRKYFQEHDKHQYPLENKNDKHRQMKIKWLISTGYPIIHSGAGRNYRTVSQVVGHGTKSTNIGKEFGEVSQVPDINIIADGVRIIKMEAVIKVIGISNQQSKKQNCSNNQRNKSFFFHKQKING